MQEETKTVHFLTAQSGDFSAHNFWVYYNSIAQYHATDKKVFIGEKNKCRYCSETNPQNFLKEAHTCPEFTGNKFLISNDECDSCNDIFSKYETHLANHSLFMRILAGTPGKGSSVSLVSNNQNISFKRNKKGIVALINNDRRKGKHDERFTRKFDMLKEEQTFDFKFKKKQHIPLFLFKTLNKIAFAIMPANELQSGGFEKFITWLRTPLETFPVEEPHEPYFYIYHNDIKTTLQYPLLTLFKKRKEHDAKNFPSYSLLLAFGKFTYQIYLPFYREDQRFLYSDSLYLPIIPEIMTAREEGKHGFIRMNGLSTEKTALEDFHFILHHTKPKSK